MTEILIRIGIILFGLVCAAIPAFFGIKSKLYHYAATGAVVAFVMIFFPYGMLLSILCSALFYALIQKENKTRKAALERKRKIAAEREREHLEQEGVIDLRDNAHSDVWPPVLIKSLNNEENNPPEEE